MIETKTFMDVLPKSLLDKYSFLETGSAARIASAVNPNAFKDILDVLEGFVLTSQLLLTKGGSRGPIPRLIDGAFESRGWIEARIDLFKRAFLFPGQNAPTVKEDPLGKRADEHRISQTYQKGYSVDNVKDRIALDVEWNPKDGNLDRDFAAYRAWHEEGLIDAAFLITRIQEDTKRIAKAAWDGFVKNNPQYTQKRQPVDYGTSTTANFEKARERVLRGDLGTCPILVIGIGEKTWDREPWDGRKVQYFSDDHNMYLVDSFEEDSEPIRVEAVTL